MADGGNDFRRKALPGGRLVQPDVEEGETGLDDADKLLRDGLAAAGNRAPGRAGVGGGRRVAITWPAERDHEVNGARDPVGVAPRGLSGGPPLGAHCPQLTEVHSPE